MKQSFYVYNDGEIKRKDNTLQFRTYEGEKRDIPIERISDIYVMSEMSFNTAFLNYISQYGIPIHFFNYYNFIREVIIRENHCLPDSYWLIRWSTIRIV
jgi:CRISPR-associated protein Cas1